MLETLTKRLGNALILFLLILVSPLAVILFLITAHAPRQAAMKPPPARPAAQRTEIPEERYYTRQLRKGPADPYFGKAVPAFAPGTELLVPKKVPGSVEIGALSLMSYRVNGKLATELAYGVDDIPYFLNAFFVDFMLHPVKQIWEAHRAVQLRVRYQLDSKQFGGRREVWQTSRQTYSSMRGDCEDYAIFLADWLMQAGFDARVVTGTYKKDGHAWVVVFKEGATYLVEATARYTSHLYPLAEFLPNYHPQTMFNRDRFWFNTGSTLTTDYRSDKWQERSRFVRFQSPAGYKHP